jgi:rSAM/selenodomain-associated transferase 2
VVDGGSSDGTPELAAELGFRVICETGLGGRGAQLNTGAKQATSAILLFLHCDSLLPPDFPEAISHSMADPKIILAAFRLGIRDSTPLISFITTMANLRSKILSLPYGDQGLCIRSEDFVHLGGFPEVPIMEDFMLVKNAGKHGVIRIMPQTVTTSIKRWQQLGPIRTTLINQLMVLGYYLKVPPDKLARFYRKIR